jgi:glycosyltransferase involved in cell wall biosynthesis
VVALNTESQTVNRLVVGESQTFGLLVGPYDDRTVSEFAEVPANQGAATPLTSVPSPDPVRVSLVIPARNEARNVAWVLGGVPDCVDEILLVDGNSQDATLAMAVHCRPDIRIVHQTENGKGAALRAGFKATTGEIIVMMDADGSMSAEEIPQYLWYLDHGFDFVKGSRFSAGGGSLDITPLRRLGNQALLALVNTLYEAQLSDLCYGFCAFRRCWLDTLQLVADGFEIETEMTVHALRAGLRVTEVPSLELPRRSGRSGLRTFRDGWRVLNTVLRDRQDHHRPARFVPNPVDGSTVGVLAQ